MKILICGDSFGADWPSVTNCVSWIDLLRKKHNITNLSQAGCGEYKILKQLKSENLNFFDRIIICHTSAFRIYINQNPLHPSGLHQHSDLILSDVESAAESEFKKNILWWFQHVFDIDHANAMHDLIKKEIHNLVALKKHIHLNFFPLEECDFCKFETNLNAVWQQNQGNVNHMNQHGNQQVFQIVESLL